MSDNELRERTILPVVIPLAAIIVTEIVVFSVSRVLLAAGEIPAVGVALGMALVILIGATVIAARPRLRTSSIIGLLVLAGLVVVAAGAVAYQRGPAYAHEKVASLPSVDVSAQNVAFSTKTLTLGAHGTIIHFADKDTQPHNIAIFPNAQSLDTPLFRGDITQPNATSDYRVPAIAPGTYYFHCDVHPSMTGTAVVG